MTSTVSIVRPPRAIIVAGLALLAGMAMVTVQHAYRLLGGAVAVAAISPPSPGQEPIVAARPETAPASPAQGEAVERVAAIPNSRVLELEAEVAVLRAELEKCRAASSSSSLAQAAGLSEEEVAPLLRRSRLASTAAELHELVRDTTPEVAWQALSAEGALRERMRSMQKNCPEDRRARQAWHSSTYAPDVRVMIEDLCARLYGLRVPSTSVERFRNRMLEDL